MSSVMQPPYIEGYDAAARWYLPRFANPWPLTAFYQRRAWDDGWTDALGDRLPPPPRQSEPECSLPRRLLDH